MAKLILNGATSGSISLESPAVSGTTTLTLPATSGTVLTTATGQTLTSPVIAGTPTGVGVLTAGTAVTASGTSVDFTSIPSWVKRITVMFSGVSTNGSSSLQVQIGSTTFTTSGYTSTSGNAYGTNLVAVASSSTGFVTQFASGSSARNGQMIIANITSNTWISSHMLGDVSGQGGCVGGGTVGLSGTLDRVRITTVNGTDAFDAGSINILFE